MTYNLTCVTAAADPGVVASCANTATDGVLGTALCVGVFFILLFGLKRGGWEVDASILASSFTAFIIAGIAAFGKWVHPIVPLAFLVILAFTGLYMRLGRS